MQRTSVEDFGSQRGSQPRDKRTVLAQIPSAPFFGMRLGPPEDLLACSETLCLKRACSQQKIEIKLKKFMASPEPKGVHQLYRLFVVGSLLRQKA